MKYILIDENCNWKTRGIIDINKTHYSYIKPILENKLFDIKMDLRKNKIQKLKDKYGKNEI